MKKLFKRILLFLMAFGFIGCAGEYNVWFKSSPSGAGFVCDDMSMQISSGVYGKKFDKSAIGSDGLLDIGDCEVIFVNGYVAKLDRLIQTKGYPNGIVITAELPQSYYEAKRAKAKEAEIARKEKAENDKKEHISKCLSGNMESCDIAIKEYGSNLNCNNYMKILRKGCNLGSGRLCALLGNEFHPISVNDYGSWKPKYGANCSLRNQNEAFKYYKKACDLGESLGCKQYTELQDDIDEIDRRERDKTQKSDITIRRK